MGLLDIFKKTPMVRCTQCGVQLKETEAHRFKGGLYCSICYSHQDFGETKPSVTIDIPSLHQRKEPEKEAPAAGSIPAIIQDIKSTFDASGIKYFSAQFANQWEVHAAVSLEGTSYTMKFIFNTANKTLGLRIYGLVHAVPGKRRELLAYLAGLQSRYRFWRFNLDDNSNVNVEYDFPPATSGHGRMAAELFLRTMKMVSDIYSELLQTAS